MTIWDEKPESEQWVKFKYPVKSGEEVQLPVYDAVEMDAWLEKVKAESDELKSYNKTLDYVYTEACGEIVELRMKLEAIKNKFKLYDQPPVGWTRTLVIKQIRNLLEVRENDVA